MKPFLFCYSRRRSKLSTTSPKLSPLPPRDVVSDKMTPELPPSPPPLPPPGDSTSENPPLPPENSDIYKFKELVIKDDQEKVEEEKKKEKEHEQKEDSDDDDNTDDEEEEEEEEASGESKRSRSERKTRKAMMKLGFKPVLGVKRVTMRKDENVVFVISKPDVFKSPSSETYVFFGQTKMQDTSKLQQIKEQLKDPSPSHGVSNPDQSSDNAVLEEVEDEDEDEDGDEIKLDPRDIELVMTQTGISWDQAAESLKDNKNDIVAAIMDRMDFN